MNDLGPRDYWEAPWMPSRLVTVPTYLSPGTVDRWAEELPHSALHQEPRRSCRDCSRIQDVVNTVYGNGCLTLISPSG